MHLQELLFRVMGRGRLQSPSSTGGAGGPMSPLPFIEPNRFPPDDPPSGG